MHHPYSFKVIVQCINKLIRQHSNAAFTVFTITYKYLFSLKLDILNPQTDTLHQAHAGTIYELRH